MTETGGAGVKPEDMGEGNYKASRDFDAAQAAFSKDKERIEAAAKDAEEALDGPEAEELKAAEEEARSHAKESRGAASANRETCVRA